MSKTKTTAVAKRPIRARYDAATTTEYNANLWVGADALSAEAAQSVEVRRKLRNRCRNEIANNSYAFGVKITLANDTIGSGPSLQMAADEAIDSLIEDEFDSWAREIGLAEKLRTARASRFESGEVFLMFVRNPSLNHPVKLDVVVMEADQVMDPHFGGVASLNPLWNDGIQYDVYGNPVSYRVLKYHPGGNFGWGVPWEYDDVPAEFIWHYFRTDRPGQRRGIPEITPALHTFAEVRRFTSAVLDASEFAARASGTLKTAAPPDEDGGDTALTALDTMPMPRGGMAVLPEGYEAQQMKAEQPVTTYGDFLYKKLGEIGRCINFPLTMMNLDSSTSNMSARYLDAQQYIRDRLIDRDDIARFLDRLFDKWMSVAAMIEGYLPSLPDSFPHEWVWPSMGSHADPEKVASAEGMELKNGTTTLPRVYSARGLNWEKEQEAAAKALGMSIDEYRAAVRFAHFGAVPAKPQEGQSSTVMPLALNGAQIEGALSVLSRQRESAISAEAATEILAGLGFDRGQAAKITAGVKSMDSGAGDVAWKRDVLRLLLAVPQAREAVYNATDIEDLISQTGLSPEFGYEAPYAAIVAPPGQPLNGDVVRDISGDVVGGEIEEPSEPPAPTPQAGNPNKPAGDQQQPEDQTPDEPTPEAKRGIMATLAGWLGISKG